MDRIAAAVGREKLIDFRFEESFGFTRMHELLYVHPSLRRDGRVVECAGLLNEHAIWIKAASVVIL